MVFYQISYPDGLLHLSRAHGLNDELGGRVGLSKLLQRPLLRLLQVLRRTLVLIHGLWTRRLPMP